MEHKIKISTQQPLLIVLYKTNNLESSREVNLRLMYFDDFLISCAIPNHPKSSIKTKIVKLNDVGRECVKMFGDVFVHPVIEYCLTTHNYKISKPLTIYSLALKDMKGFYVRLPSHDKHTTPFIQPKSHSGLYSTTCLCIYSPENKIIFARTAQSAKSTLDNTITLIEHIKSHESQLLDGPHEDGVANIVEIISKIQLEGCERSCSRDVYIDRKLKTVGFLDDFESIKHVVRRLEESTGYKAVFGVSILRV